MFLPNEALGLEAGQYKHILETSSNVGLHLKKPNLLVKVKRGQEHGRVALNYHVSPLEGVPTQQSGCRVAQLEPNDEGSAVRQLLVKMRQPSLKADVKLLSF